jgi:hypothetical protein
MPKRAIDADSRIFFDELASLAASRLKATGATTLKDKWVYIPFAKEPKFIGLAHTKFPSGGSWSQFVCPKCGRTAKKPRLIDGVSSRCSSLRPLGDIVVRWPRTGCC